MFFFKTNVLTLAAASTVALLGLASVAAAESHVYCVTCDGYSGPQPGDLIGGQVSINGQAGTYGKTMPTFTVPSGAGAVLTYEAFAADESLVDVGISIDDDGCGGCGTAIAQGTARAKQHIGSLSTLTVDHPQPGQVYSLETQGVAMGVASIDWTMNFTPPANQPQH